MKALLRNAAKLFLASFVFLALLLLSRSPALALGMPSCLSKNIDFAAGDTPRHTYQLGSISGLSFTLRTPDLADGYLVELFVDKNASRAYSGSAEVRSGRVTFNITSPTAFEAGNYDISLLGESGVFCLLWEYEISTRLSADRVYAIQSRAGPMGTQSCVGGTRTTHGCLQAGVPFRVHIEGLTEGNIPFTGPIRLTMEGQSDMVFGYRPPSVISIPITYNAPGDYGFAIEHPSFIAGTGRNFYRGTFRIQASCTVCTTELPPIIPGADDTAPAPYRICSQIDVDTQADLHQQCIDCIGGDGGEVEGIWTAVGCIDRDPVQIVQVLVKLGLGMGGGLALIVILASGFILSTSQGDPKRVGEAKEWLTAAIMGLLMVIFSVVLLRFIGFSVLRIPGFGG